MTCDELILSSGATYIGEVQFPGGIARSAPVRHGSGTCEYPNGEKYEGQWRHDKRHGMGVLHYNDGSRYEGMWYNDLRNGKGKQFTWKGEVFTGKFIGGQRNGHGVYEYSDGSIYDGEWKWGPAWHWYSSPSRGIS